MNKQALISKTSSLNHQHQELFQFAKMLDHALIDQNLSKLQSIVDFLDNHIHQHFHEEELYMESIDYDMIDAHKKEHSHFKTQLNSLHNFINKSHSKAHLIFKMRKLFDDLLTHMNHVDSQIGI